MKSNRVQLYRLFIILACLTLCGCSDQGQKAVSEQTAKIRPEESNSKQPASPSDFSNRPAAAQFPAAEQAADQESTPRVSGLQVSLEPGNAVTGDQLKAKVEFPVAAEDGISMLYIWSINGEKVQESVDPVFHAPVKCGDFVELQVSLANELQEEIAGCSSFIGNAPPRLSLVEQKLDQTGLYLGRLEILDPEQDAVTLYLTSSPKGMSIDSRSKTIEWLVGPGQQGAFDVAIAAKDERGAEALLTYQIKVAREAKGETKERHEHDEPSSTSTQ